ncbi:MAG: peptide deformylase [Gammaproteobacteria bacterium]|nr:peptide deformylase [Gammaproteobacteria bacterium]
MAVLEILKHPDVRLQQVAEPVERFDAALHRFIDDLEQTRLAGPGAVGIAAPQVGEVIQLVIVDISTMKKPHPNHGHLVLINPEIIKWKGHEVGREGCLSVPDFTGNVIRAQQIVLQAQNPQGEVQRFEMQGFEARAVQHELDHLEGMLFLDRLVSRRSDLFARKVFQKKAKNRG